MLTLRLQSRGKNLCFSARVPWFANLNICILLKNVVSLYYKVWAASQGSLFLLLSAWKSVYISLEEEFACFKVGKICSKEGFYRTNLCEFFAITGRCFYHFWRDCFNKLGILYFWYLSILKKLQKGRFWQNLAKKIVSWQLFPTILEIINNHVEPTDFILKKLNSRGIAGEFFVIPKVSV